jgi:hypothetical protein
MIKATIYWIFIICFQILILNHLDISTYIYPQVFIILLIAFPLHIKKSYQIIGAFSLGLFIDFLVYTPGIHTSACLWLMGLRMLILDRQDLVEQTNNRWSYSIQNVGFVPFSYTALLLVFFYHFYVLWLEGIGHIHVSHLFITGVSSSLLSLMIIGIFEALSIRQIE